jgi:hypothetical protein
MEGSGSGSSPSDSNEVSEGVTEAKNEANMASNSLRSTPFGPTAEVSKRVQELAFSLLRTATSFFFPSPAAKIAMLVDLLKSSSVVDASLPAPTSFSSFLLDLLISDVTQFDTCQRVVVLSPQVHGIVMIYAGGVIARRPLRRGPAGARDHSGIGGCVHIVSHSYVLSPRRSKATLCLPWLLRRTRGHRPQPEKANASTLTNSPCVKRWR